MAFNADTFLNATVQAAMDTAVTPIPEGDFPFQISKVEINSGTIKNGDRAGKTWAQLKMRCLCLDPNVAAELGREEANQNMFVFLDLTEDESGLDIGTGKNVDLGKLREAVGQNDEDEEWMPSMLQGGTFLGTVKHKFREDSQDAYGEMVRWVAMED